MAIAAHTTCNPPRATIIADVEVVVAPTRRAHITDIQAVVTRRRDPRELEQATPLGPVRVCTPAAPSPDNQVGELVRKNLVDAVLVLT